jgi:hypothetical protein
VSDYAKGIVFSVVSVPVVSAVVFFVGRVSGHPVALWPDSFMVGAVAGIAFILATDRFAPWFKRDRR